ncbi:MAG: acyl--CoA ligase [Enterococcus sp.]|nr:acyl--CoA ligase [Enterococcus sp.]
MISKKLPSLERPWMKYYPSEFIENLTVPECTLGEYLQQNSSGEHVTAIHYYGRDVSWKEVFDTSKKTARSLRALGFSEGSQIPVFFKAMPEFIFLLLGAEIIGASLLCRDNTLEENVEATKKSQAKTIFAHDYLSQGDLNIYRKDSKIHQAVLLSPYEGVNRLDVPSHIHSYIQSQYPNEPAYGPQIMSWKEFLALGESYEGIVEAEKDINRALFRAYTSGSTGPSKQVIHSAKTMVGNICQMNFYGANDEFRPTWLVTHLPTALVAVVVAMYLLPMASNKLLILDPFCDFDDIDLELMRYRPNCWPLIPMFIEIIMKSKRIPEDYDMSHLMAAGAGCEALNNSQFDRIQDFLTNRNCNIRFTSGYGSSEGCSNMTLPLTEHPMGNGNVGIPMPLTLISIFEPGSQQELSYNQIGEICCSSPSVMLGYDNEYMTRMALQQHDDGQIWLHTGDLGYMNEDGVVYVLSRGRSPRFGMADLELLPMENYLADCKIPGIKDAFYVFINDPEHESCFLPVLYVVLYDGYKFDNVAEDIRASLEPHMQPIEIIELDERPFFHFKTNRVNLAREFNERLK